MAADSVNGKREAIVTEYILRILGLDVRHHFRGLLVVVITLLLLLFFLLLCQLCKGQPLESSCHLAIPFGALLIIAVHALHDTVFP